MDAQSSMTYLVIGGLWHWLILALAIGYIIGAIPVGRMIRKAAGVADYESPGSLAAPGGLAAFFADAAKGLVAVFLANYLYGTAPALLAALGVVLGAAFPITSFFKNGQPLATFFGAALAISPEAAAVFAIVWAALWYTGARPATAALAVLAPPVSAALAPLTAGIKVDPAIPLTLAMMALIVLLSYARDLWRAARGTTAGPQSA